MTSGALLFLLFFGANPAAARTYSVSAKWNCDQAVPSPGASAAPLPSAAVVTFTLESPDPLPSGVPSAAPRVNADAFRAFIRPAVEQAAGASRVDYSTCLATLADRLDFAVYQACDTGLFTSAAQDEEKQCRAQLDRAVPELRRMVGTAAVREASLGGRAPFPPMTSLALRSPPVSDPSLLETAGDPTGPDASNVSSMCISYNSSILRSREFLTGALPGVVRGLMQDGRESCANQLLSSILSDAASQMPEGCPNAACAAAAFQMRELLGVLDPVLPVIPEEVRSNIAGCTTGEAANPGYAARLLSIAVRGASSCVRPAVGGEAQVVMAVGVPAVPPKFRLSRPDPTHFVAEIYADFRPADQSESMRNHASQCLASYSGQLRGPDGQDLKIQLVSEAGTPPAPQVPINIVGAGERANSANWNSSIDCPTVLHELLHVLGLVDEYQERWMGYHVVGGQVVESGSNTAEVDLPEYDCRSVGSENSVMRNQYSAVSGAQGGGAAAISRVLRAASGGQTHADEATPSSILNPAQFRMITEPGCVASNQLYMTCAESAYATSLSNVGTGCPRGQPAACRQASAWSR